ncbi:hypothetical protein K443DRAFT_686329 [Laccaria amethystina LaAM-08-1]|uniref:Uncharacterized protein n=1 Tax=Laccaria amethystina LaAM-08-1 TaxID=1095629 RepID=A0A0C9WMB6_9AGAR|nr:hypothetical protein K443DRAFT_686329 [Laccaria amethystina LaAM-08-1]
MPPRLGRRIGDIDKDQSIKAQLVVLEKTPGIGSRIDIVLPSKLRANIRIGS